jgi:hypothetical protein
MSGQPTTAALIAYSEPPSAYGAPHRKPQIDGITNHYSRPNHRGGPKTKLNRAVGVREESGNHHQNHNERSYGNWAIPSIEELLPRSYTGDARRFIQASYFFGYHGRIICFLT